MAEYLIETGLAPIAKGGGVSNNQIIDTVLAEYSVLDDGYGSLSRGLAQFSRELGDKGSTISNLGTPLLRIGATISDTIVIAADTTTLPPRGAQPITESEEEYREAIAGAVLAATRNSLSQFCRDVGVEDGSFCVFVSLPMPWNDKPNTTNIFFEQNTQLGSDCTIVFFLPPTDVADNLVAVIKQLDDLRSECIEALSNTYFVSDNDIDFFELGYFYDTLVGDLAQKLSELPKPSRYVASPIGRTKSRLPQIKKYERLCDDTSRELASAKEALGLAQAEVKRLRELEVPLRQSVVSVRNEIDSLKAQVRTLGVQLEAAQVIITNENDSELEAVRQELEQAREELNQARRDLEAAQSELRSAKQVARSSEAIDEIKLVTEAIAFAPLISSRQDIKRALEVESAWDSADLETQVAIVFSVANDNRIKRLFDALQKVCSTDSERTKCGTNDQGWVFLQWLVSVRNRMSKKPIEFDRNPKIGARFDSQTMQAANALTSGKVENVLLPGISSLGLKAYVIASA